MAGDPIITNTGIVESVPRQQYLALNIHHPTEPRINDAIAATRTDNHRLWSFPIQLGHAR